MLRKQARKGTQSLIDYTEKMIAALAHEIRNPLNSMKGAAKFLNEKYSSYQEVKEFSDLIMNEIIRVENYLNEFLSFSRGTKLKMSSVNLKNYLTGIIMTVKHGFEYGISADLDGADCEVDLDNEQIRQVLINLLSNAKDAVKAAAPDVPEVRIRASVRKKNALIEVSDNGTGMKAAVLKNIFVPFFTTKEDGMGIGLSISRTIIQRHRGRLKVSTRPGKGSAFTIELPIRRRCTGGG